MILDSIVTNLERFERVIYVVLALLLAVAIAFAVIELGYLLYIGLTKDTVYLLENHELLALFGFFLLVLIGIELLGTVKAYIRENVIHVEIVLILAIIAISRKVILLDLATESEVTVIGIGIIILALCSGYYFIRKAGTPG
jgi:uncharacterized membrane protein (DUF373 family)